MYKMAMIILLCFKLSTLFSQENKVADYRIDLPNANGGVVSQIFEEIEYIPLETSKESILNKIDQLEITDQYYIVLDQLANSIILFDKSGKYHTRINKIPNIKALNIPGTLFDKITIDRSKNEIIASSNFIDYSTRLFYFNFDGKYLREEKIKIPFSDYYPLENHALTLFIETPSDLNEHKPNPSNSLLFVKENLVYKTELPIEKTLNIPAPDSYLTAGANYYSSKPYGELIFTKVYDYNLYSIDSAGLKYTYKLIFPLSNSIPLDFLSNKQYEGKRTDFLKQNPQIIYGLSNIFHLKDWLIFKTSSFEKNNNNDMFYNTKTGTLICYSRIQPDELNQFLPIYNFMARVQNTDDQYIYTSISAANMFSAIDENKARNIKYSQKMTEYFSKSSRRDNPLIVRLKIKQNL